MFENIYSFPATISTSRSAPLADERRFYLRCCARHAAPLPPYAFSQDEPHRLIEAAGLVRRTQ